MISTLSTMINENMQFAKSIKTELFGVLPDMLKTVIGTAQKAILARSPKMMKGILAISAPLSSVASGLPPAQGWYAR